MPGWQRLSPGGTGEAHGNGEARNGGGWFDDRGPFRSLASWCICRQDAGTPRDGLLLDNLADGFDELRFRHRADDLIADLTVFEQNQVGDAAYAVA